MKMPTQMKIVSPCRTRLRNRHYLLCAAIFYAIVITIYFSCGRFYNAQTLICYSRQSPEETASSLKHPRLQLTADLTAYELDQKRDEKGKLFISDHLLRMTSRDKEYVKGGKPQASTLMTAESEERQSQVDRLLPLREMFAKAGAEYKEKEKALNWTSAEVPLSDLKVKANKPEVLLLVIVSSAPERQDRRNAIRETWWKGCSQVVKCVFFTDGLQLQEQQKKELHAERTKFGDIKFSPTETASMIFGERFLYQIMWAKARFKFQYFLRLDDDYFLCMDRLVNELSSRPKVNLSWGRYHCHDENLVYMDESWALFSEDVIEKFLAQDLRSMLCHPFGDQTFTLWINATGVNLTDFDDNRLHYWPPASKLNEFFSKTDVCDKFMGVHGSYPDLMQYLWRKSNDGPKNITELTLLRNTCSLLKVFDVNRFAGIYKHKPYLCLDRPRWVSKLKSWQGGEKLTF